MGPPGFEPGSDGPQPPSIGQANPRARGKPQLRAALNGATSSIGSKVSDVHAAATITLQAHFIEGFSVGFTIGT